MSAITLMTGKLTEVSREQLLRYGSHFHISWPRYNQNEPELELLKKKEGVKVSTFDNATFEHKHFSAAMKILRHPRVLQTAEDMGVPPPKEELDQMVLDEALGTTGASGDLRQFLCDYCFARGSRRKPLIGYSENGIAMVISGSMSDKEDKFTEGIRTAGARLEALQHHILKCPDSARLDAASYAVWQERELPCRPVERTVESLLEMMGNPDIAATGFLSGDSNRIRSHLQVIVNGLVDGSKESFIAAFGRKSKIQTIADFLVSVANGLPDDSYSRNLRSAGQALSCYRTCMTTVQYTSIEGVNQLNEIQAKFGVLKKDFLQRLHYDKLLSMFGDIDISAEGLAKLGFLGGDLKAIRGHLGWLSKTFIVYKPFGSLADFWNVTDSVTCDTFLAPLPIEEKIEWLLKNDMRPPPGATAYKTVMIDMEIDDDRTLVVLRTLFPETLFSLVLQCPRGKKTSHPRFYYKLVGKHFSSVDEFTDQFSDNEDKIAQKSYKVYEDKPEYNR